MGRLNVFRVIYGSHGKGNVHTRRFVLIGWIFLSGRKDCAQPSIAKQRGLVSLNHVHFCQQRLNAQTSFKFCCCLMQNLVWASEEFDTWVSDVFLVFFETRVWASREENRGFPRIMHQPSIWPQHYHSITTCWWSAASYTHARTLSRARPFTCMHRLWYSRAHVCVHFTIHSILATNMLHCVQPAATVEQYSTLQNRYGLSFNKPKQDR